jgi:cytochrome c5
MKLFSMKNMTWFFATMMAASVAYAFGQDVVLPDGEGKKIVQDKCTACHDASYIAKQHLNKDEWTDMVKIMVASGAMVTDAEMPVLVDYLVENWGPAGDAAGGGADSGGLPAGDGKKIVEEKCTVCHDAGLIVAKHQSKDEWTDTVKIMVASGAMVTDAEMPVLIDYLTKNFGPQ